LPLTVCLTHELHFKQHYPRTQIIRVDVAGSAIFGTPRFPYKITGLGLSFVPPNFDRSLLDVAYSVSDQLAFSYCHQIAQCEGLLLGASTGAIMAAGLAYASTIWIDWVYNTKSV
jgi:cysteine synthase